MNEPTFDPDGATHYEVRVRGVLSQRLQDAFPELEARAEHGTTLLGGPVTDQAALHGVLARIEALGLELLEVRLAPELND